MLLCHYYKPEHGHAGPHQTPHHYCKQRLRLNMNSKLSSLVEDLPVSLRVDFILDWSPCSNNLWGSSCSEFACCPFCLPGLSSKLFKQPVSISLQATSLSSYELRESDLKAVAAWCCYGAAKPFGEQSIWLFCLHPVSYHEGTMMSPKPQLHIIMYLWAAAQEWVTSESHISYVWLLQSHCSFSHHSYRVHQHLAAVPYCWTPLKHFNWLGLKWRNSRHFTGHF